jgi:hypothetical protein
MSRLLSFPPNWVIRPRADFHRFQSGIDSQLAGELLIEAASDATIQGNFRFSVTGSAPIRAVFKANSIMDVGGADAFKLTYEVHPDEISIRTNSFTSDFIDVYKG